MFDCFHVASLLFAQLPPPVFAQLPPPVLSVLMTLAVALITVSVIWFLSMTSNLERPQHGDCRAPGHCVCSLASAMFPVSTHVPALPVGADHQLQTLAPMCPTDV